MEDGASDYLGLLAWRREPFSRVVQRGDVGLRLGHGCSLEALGSGATPPLSRWQLLKWICDMECCGGRGEAPACGVFFEATRVRWSPTADVARLPCVCAFARLRCSLREVWIWCYHPVRWSAVLQRYFGDGSRTAVDFWCGAVFFSRFSVDARSRREFGGGFLRVFVGGRRAS